METRATPEDDRTEGPAAGSTPGEAASPSEPASDYPMGEAVPRADVRSTPRATVLTFVLNNEAFVGAMLDSILAQWRPDIEILVIDDGSTDGSFEAARKALAAHPSAAATLCRNPAPLGMGQFARVLQRVNAPIIIQADSDDIALPGRIDRILACFEADPNCKLVTTNAILLSETGFPIGLFDQEAADAILDDAVAAASSVGSIHWLGATTAYHRSLLDDFPPLDSDVFPYGLDLLLPFRALLQGTHHYLAQPYVGWRQHGRNTHKLAGVGSDSNEALERHGAFELMALAQKIRDLDTEYARGMNPDRVGRLKSICHRAFLDHFTQWSRARNALSHGHGRTATQTRLAFNAVPPLMQLHHGRRYHFGKGEAFGRLAQEWDGIHAAEEDANWTSRTALLTFGLLEGETRVIGLGVRATSALTRRLCLSVNLGPFQEFEITTTETIIRMTIGPAVPTDTLSLTLHVPGAARPSEVGINTDTRLLGMQLLFLEVDPQDHHTTI